MDFTEIHSIVNGAVSMADLLQEYGTTLRTPSHEEQISCPFHGKDSRPSARHYPATNSVYCFTCKKSWDPIRFLMDKRAMRFREALEHISKKYGLQLGNVSFGEDGSRYVKFRKDAVRRPDALPESAKMMVVKDKLEERVAGCKGKIPPRKYLDMVYVLSGIRWMENPRELVPAAGKVLKAIDRMTGEREGADG